MLKKFKIIIALAFAVATFSCNRLNPMAEGEVVASVGDKELFLSEVEGIFTDGLTPQDSVILLETYVDMWVKKQLKVLEAEKIFSESSADIEAMVEDYRNSLLTYKLDQRYVDQRLDTEVLDKEMSDYYNERRQDFVLDRNIVKGIIVKLSDKYRQKAKLKELMVGRGDKYQDFIEMADKNGFEVQEFLTWTDFPDFLSNLPTNKLRNYEDMLTAKGVTEMLDGDDLYYAMIADSRKPGDIAPLDRVTDIIKRIILNHRRQEIIRNYEDSIYKAGVMTEFVKIRIN